MVTSDELMGCKSCQKPKAQHRKGLWSPEEDQKLRDFIVRYGHSCWSTVPVKAGENCLPAKRSSRTLVNLSPLLACRGSAMYLGSWERERWGNFVSPENS